MDIERNSAGLCGVTSPLNPPGKDSREEESASPGRGWGGVCTLNMVKGLLGEWSGKNLI